MRYYVYVSDSKLDMLAPQVPRKLREKVAAELTIDLKLLTLSLKENPNEGSRYGKIEAVRQHLLSEGAIGTLEGSTGWFEGTLPMHWGPYLHHDGHDFDAQLPMVFFAAETPAVQVGLAGSRRHLLGEEASLPDNVMNAYRSTGPLFSSFSHGYSILAAVRQALENEPGAESIDAGKAVAITVTKVLGEARIQDLPPNPMEFLAMRLFDAVVALPAREQRVVLGTPLYVARTV